MQTPEKNKNRRKTRQIMIGNVPVGGGAPITVQSMTNTETCDVGSTVTQIDKLVKAGADIVRVSVPTMEAADAFFKIRDSVAVPIVADIHFDYRIALKVLESGVDCLRINPGNIGNEKRIRAVVGSAMVESALTQIEILDKLDFQNFKISLKASEIYMTLAAYRQLAPQINQPLHLGITEAGSLRSGTVKSAIGLGALLMDGIGDTIRVSLAADPVEEVKVGFDILKSLGLRNKGVNLVACPSCSRQNFDVISVVNELESRLEDIQIPIDVAIIGCIVNGPGEAKVAEIGLTGASPNNLIYVNGTPDHKVTNAGLVDELEEMIRAKVEAKRLKSENIIATG